MYFSCTHLIPILITEQSKAMLSSISSKGTIANITSTGRLHCDVFGALSSSAAKKKRNINPRTKKPLSMSVVATTNKSSRSLDHCEDLMESDRSGQSDDPLTLEELLEENCLDSSFRRSKAIKKNRRATLANNKSKSMVFESESKRKNLAELLDTDSVS